jgi:hypothetical protein
LRARVGFGETGQRFVHRQCCALSQGYTADIEPDAWKIANGDLYLNYNKKVQARWEKDQANCISSAEKNWPKLIGTK